MTRQPQIDPKTGTTYRLETGYAETSSRKYPREPETVVVGETEVNAARYVGEQIRDCQHWNVFKIPNRKRYYFQIRLWR
jgi:hypothetical protein